MKWFAPLWILGCTPTPDDPTDGSPSPVVPAVCGEVPCVPAPDDPEVLVGWHSVAPDPLGGFWLAWAEVHGPHVVGTWIARSPEAGVLGAPIEVPTPEMPIVGGGEKPHLAVSEDRVALAYTGTGGLRHGDAHAAYVHVGQREGASVAFDPAIQVDDSTGFLHVLEHARVAFAPDGELWILWKRQQYGISDVAMWAREDSGLVPELVHGGLSELHDCSPPDLRFGSQGRALLALRQNLDWVIETVVLTAEPGLSFDSPVQVSDNDWAWNDECPDDGPRIAQADDGTLATVWIAPSDLGYRAFISSSSDGGATWTPHVADHPDFDYGETFPTVAFAGSGEVWTTAQDLWGDTRLFRRDTVDGPVVETGALETPEGVSLTEVELFSARGRTVALGLGDDGTLYLLDLD